MALPADLAGPSGFSPTPGTDLSVEDPQLLGRGSFKLFAKPRATADVAAWFNLPGVLFMCLRKRSSDMVHRHLPAQAMAPTLPNDMPSEDAVRIWIDLMMATDKLVMAGLALDGSVKDVRAAYGELCAANAERHGQHMARLARRLREVGDEPDGALFNVQVDLLLAKSEYGRETVARSVRSESYLATCAHGACVTFQVARDKPW